MNYYYTTGVTKDGFPIYKCIRGTSALEGYHRHLRALVAQGCISPRLLIALLRCFNYRWNVERSVDNEDLPPFYSGWYSHWNVESSQDATANWFDEPVHSDWISTKEFVSSGEKFYLISNGHDGDANDGAESDEDDLENTLEHQTWTAMLPPSLQWLARQEGVKIPTTRFATPQERDLFKDNYRRFRSSSKSQDSHDQWDFAAMAVWWDAYVDELEKKRGFSSGIFRKTEAILRSFYKERLRIINIASTVAQSSESGAPLREVNFELQQALRDDGGFAFLEGAPRPKRARGSSCLNCVQHCPRIPHVSSSLRGSVLRAAAMDTAELTFDDGTMANGHPSRSLQVNFKVPPPGPGSVPDESANNRMFPTRDGISQRIFVPPMQAPGTMFSPPPPPPPPPLISASQTSSSSPQTAFESVKGQHPAKSPLPAMWASEEWLHCWGRGSSFSQAWRKMVLDSGCRLLYRGRKSQASWVSFARLRPGAHAHKHRDAMGNRQWSSGDGSLGAFRGRAHGRFISSLFYGAIRSPRPE